MLAASFDGTGATYFSRSKIAATKTYPHSAGFWTRLYRQTTPHFAGTMFASATADMADGTACYIQGDIPSIYLYGSSGYSRKDALDSLFTDPYLHRMLVEWASASLRNIYIDGVLWATDTTTRSADLSSGLSRFGIQPDDNYPAKGLLKDVVIRAGAVDATYLAQDATPGFDFSTLAAVKNWYKLNGDGNDAIGGEHMTPHGTVSYVTWPTGTEAATAPLATVQTAINAVHCGTHALRSEMPTVQTNKASPISTSGWSNLLRVDWLDVAFTGDAGAWTTRAFLYLPILPNGKLLFFGNGHVTAADWVNYGGDLIIKSALAEGYAVCAFVSPLYGTTDSSYPGSGSLHDPFWDYFTAGVANPMEFFLGPPEICMNYLAPLYAERSVIGLSGEAQRMLHYMAIDSRVNHAGLFFRGTMADKRRNSDPADFEQCILPKGFKEEDFFRLAAQSNRRVIVFHHPNDTCCFNIVDYRDMASAAPVGYDATIFGPIRVEFPYADASAREVPAGSLATHSFYQADWGSAASSALSTALLQLPGQPSADYKNRPRITSGIRGMLAANGLLLDRDLGVYFFVITGTPVDGTSGTGAGWAAPGSMCVDVATPKIYINGGTKLAPVWNVVASA